MPNKQPKKQKAIITITDQGDGEVRIKLRFKPKVSGETRSLAANLASEAISHLYSKSKNSQG